MCSGVVGGRAVQSCGVRGVGGVGGVRCVLELCAWTGAAAMKTEYCADMYCGEWVLFLLFSYRTHTFRRARQPVIQNTGRIQGHRLLLSTVYCDEHNDNDNENYNDNKNYNDNENYSENYNERVDGICVGCHVHY